MSCSCVGSCHVSVCLPEWRRPVTSGRDARVMTKSKTLHNEAKAGTRHRRPHRRSGFLSLRSDGFHCSRETLSVANHEQTVRLVIEWINSRADLQPITGVRHRVVHGSERFTTSVVIDDGVASALDAFCEIAPSY